MRRMSFQVKLSINFIILLIVFLIVPTYYMCQRAVILQKEDLRNKILSLAKIVSMFIDGDKHSQISLKRQSQDTVLYQEIRAVLKKIRNIDPIIDSVYTMVKTDKKNIWMFVVDSGDIKGRVAYCGESYDISRFPQMQLAFDMPSVDKELTVDKWGVWLSSYAPIYNSQGEAVAIVGLDVSAKSIRQMQMLLYKGLLVICAVGIVFSLLISWILAKNISRSLRDLIAGVREVEQGNFMQKVKVRKDGELQELADAFNKMTEGLQEAQSKLQRYYLNTIKALAQALEVKDPYTGGHAERVTRYAINIAKRLGFSDEDITLLEDICILHDIGKIGIPEKILGKPGPLTEEEWRIVKRHPTIGEEILKPIEFLRPVLSIVRDHHERPDGKGYPNGLKREEISLLAAIVAVADAFDAMTSDRPYRKAFTKDDAINILKENKDKQFNSQVVDAFIASLRRDVS